MRFMFKKCRYSETLKRKRKKNYYGIYIIVVVAVILTRVYNYTFKIKLDGVLNLFGCSYSLLSKHIRFASCRTCVYKNMSPII